MASRITCVDDVMGVGEQPGMWSQRMCIGETRQIRSIALDRCHTTEHLLLHSNSAHADDAVLAVRLVVVNYSLAEHRSQLRHGLIQQFEISLSMVK